MDSDQRVGSPANSCSRPNSSSRPNASRNGSAASQTSGISLRSNHSNNSNVALRTGRVNSGQDTERSSTPTKVLPPIGQQEDTCINNCVDRSSQSSSAMSTEKKASPSHMDKTAGTGESVPKIARGFRRETSPEHRSGESHQSTNSKSFKRSVSFGVHHRKTYDGREVTLQSFETQTDWDWLEDAVLDESVKILEPRQKQPLSDSVVKSVVDEDVGSTEKEEEGPLPYPYSNDEFGIPLLDLSSDSDDSSDDESQKPKQNENKLLPSVGPPQILQYIRESEQREISSMEPEVGERIDTSDYPQDEHGQVHGYFSGTCEFCMCEILPFPTPEQQQQQPPEELFCCEEYRHFIETMLAEDHTAPSKSLIDVKPHPHFGSKKARKVAQQKAQLRMRERELLRQQQNISAQSTSQQSSYYQTSSRQSRNTTSGATERPVVSVNKDVASPATVAHHHVSLPRPSKHNTAADHAHAEKPAPAVFNVLPPVARQMKTINYQLSSQKCLEEGWTVRPPTPMLHEEVEDIFIPEPLDPAFAALGKARKPELIQKFYDDGQPFITIFPDGSGNVFYSSGHVAVVISCQEPGQYNYLVMEDDPGPPALGVLARPPQVLGLFGSDGHASCCYSNGKLRLFLDEYGGIELDKEGAKRKKWFWKDTETHVHAPPFQPVCFSLNSNIAIRVMTQENMSLTFRCKARSCRLPVGAKLKLVNPENLPPKEIDSDILFINEKRALTQTILNRISNLLRFPKSPKVEKILPPLHITSKIHKNEKMQQQREAAMAAAQAKKTKQRLVRPVVVS